MSTQALAPALVVEHAGPVTVARLTRADYLDEGTIAPMGGQLYRLVDEGCRRLVLDLSAVQRISSTFVGKLLALHQRLAAVGGRLALCGLEPMVADVFELLRLRDMFGIYATEPEALQSVQ